MTLLSLAIQNCRNLTAVDVALDPGLNLFVGPNGAGKTAVLEAVHFLARGRSFRTSRASKVIRYEQPQLIVRGRVQPEDGPMCTLAVSRPRRGPMVVHVDGEKVPGISVISRYLPVQVMLPGVSDLVFGGPSERRRWLDWGVFHVKPSYLRIWRRYNQLLKQRNAHLKHRKADAVLSAFTEALIEAAEPLNQARKDYVCHWLPRFKQTLSGLAPELSALQVALAPNGILPTSGQDTPTLEDILSQNLSRDVKLGATHGGPHRLELALTLNGHLASERLSRGQGKTLALAMKVSQAQVLAEQTGQRSLFLIDDAGAELDKAHNAAFFETMAATNAQVLATGTEAPWTGAAYSGTERTLFHVKHGQIEAPSSADARTTE